MRSVTRFWYRDLSAFDLVHKMLEIIETRLRFNIPHSLIPSNFGGSHDDTEPVTIDKDKVGQSVSGVYVFPPHSWSRRSDRNSFPRGEGHAGGRPGARHAKG